MKQSISKQLLKESLFGLLGGVVILLLFALLVLLPYIYPTSISSSLGFLISIIINPIESFFANLFYVEIGRSGGFLLFLIIGITLGVSIGISIGQKVMRTKGLPYGTLAGFVATTILSLIEILLSIKYTISLPLWTNNPYIIIPALLLQTTIVIMLCTHHEDIIKELEKI